MSDLKKFLEEYKFISTTEYAVFLPELGMFFWERGGIEHKDYCIKWFVPPVRKENIDLIFDICLDKAKTNIEGIINNRDMQDFLDCLACLGEDKVKELIKKEGV
jgi:hypothetical protein